MTGKILVTRLEDGKLIVESDDGIVEYDSQFLVAALLVYVAQGDGTIDPAESAQMIDLIRERYKLKSGESLELVTRAMTEVIAEPELARLLTDLARYRKCTCFKFPVTIGGKYGSSSLS